MRPRSARAEVPPGVALRNAATAKARAEATQTPAEPYLKLVPEALVESEDVEPDAQAHKPRYVALHDTGLLFEGEKSREIRERSRARAAYLREKYQTERPPSDLETMTKLGEVFMSPDKRAALEEKRKAKAIIKKIPTPHAANELKKPIHVGWFGGLGGVLSALAALAASMGTPEVQSRVGSPDVRAGAERVLRDREALRTQDAVTDATYETLAERTAGYEDEMDLLRVRQQSLEDVLLNEEVRNALDGYFDAPTTEEREIQRHILEDLGYRPIQIQAGDGIERIVLPILVPEIAEALQEYADAATPERKIIHARNIEAMGYRPVRVNAEAYTVIAIPQTEDAK